MTTLEAIGTFMFLASTAAVASFVILYLLRSPWRASREGRQLMGFMSVVAVIMVLAVLFGRILTDPVFEDIVVWLRAALYTALAFVSWRFVYLLLRAQRDSRRADRERRVSDGEGS